MALAPLFFARTAGSASLPATSKHCSLSLRANYLACSFFFLLFLWNTRDVCCPFLFLIDPSFLFRGAAALSCLARWLELVWVCSCSAICSGFFKCCPELLSYVLLV